MTRSPIELSDGQLKIYCEGKEENVYLYLVVFSGNAEEEVVFCLSEESFGGEAAKGQGANHRGQSSRLQE